MTAQLLPALTQLEGELPDELFLFSEPLFQLIHLVFPCFTLAAGSPVWFERRICGALHRFIFHTHRHYSLRNKE